MRRIVMMMSLVLTSSAALAHSGHDHSHWSSLPLHLLSVGAVLSVLAVAFIVYKKRLKLKREALDQ